MGASKSKGSSGQKGAEILKELRIRGLEYECQERPSIQSEGPLGHRKQVHAQFPARRSLWVKRGYREGLAL